MSAEGQKAALDRPSAASVFQGHRSKAVMDEPQRISFQYHWADDNQETPRQVLRRFSELRFDGYFIGCGELDCFALRCAKRGRAVRYLDNGAGGGSIRIEQRRHPDPRIGRLIRTIGKEGLKDLPTGRSHDDVITESKAGLEAVVLHSEEALFGGHLMTGALEHSQTLPTVCVHGLACADAHQSIKADFRCRRMRV
jgi:hypothetical protein